MVIYLQDLEESLTLLVKQALTPLWYLSDSNLSCHSNGVFRYCTCVPSGYYCASNPHTHHQNYCPVLRSLRSKLCPDITYVAASCWTDLSAVELLVFGAGGTTSESRCCRNPWNYLALPGVRIGVLLVAPLADE